MASTLIDPLLAAQSSANSFAPRRQAPSSVRVDNSAVFRRRRFAVAAVAVFFVASGSLASGAFARQPGAANQSIPRTVVVQQGDTIWSIAKRISPKGDISDLVDALVEVNGTDLVAGQLVRIP